MRLWGRLLLVGVICTCAPGCELLELLFACDQENDPNCEDPERGHITGTIVVPTASAASRPEPIEHPLLADAVRMMQDMRAERRAAERPTARVERKYRIPDQSAVNAAWAKEAATERWRPGEVIVRAEGRNVRLERRAFAQEIAGFLGDGTEVEIRLCNTDTMCLAEVSRDGEPLDELETFAVAQRLRRMTALRYSEVNRVLQMSRVPNDDLFAVQWHYGKMRLPAAWDITVGSDQVVGAVIDTGILSDHPELDTVVVGGADLIDDEDVAGDGDGRDDDGFDVGDNACGSGCHSHHGTHVAGTMAAETDNAEMVSGVSWAGQLLAVRVLGQGGGAIFDIVGGVYWSIGSDVDGVARNQNPADVINMSLGGRGTSEAMDEAIQEAIQFNTIVIVAAGNENEDAADFTPASAPGAITIAAVSNSGEGRAVPRRASYSNFGADVDLAAPGGEQAEDIDGDGNPDGVLSTVRDEVTFYQGTSMASPHVAGVAMLMKSIDINVTGGQALNFMASTADDSIQCTGCGAGMVNAVQALRAMTGDENAPLLVPPDTVVRVGRQDFDVQVAFENVGAQSVDATLSIGGPDRDKLIGLEQTSVTVGGAETHVIDLQIDRAGDDTGEATITAVFGDNQSADVRVVWSADVISSATSVDVGAFRVEGDSISPERLVSALEIDGYAYKLFNLTPGDYLVIGISDDDLDGNPGEENEGIGVFPRIQEARLVTVGANETVTDADFLVAPGFVYEENQGTGDGPVGAACESSLDCQGGLYCEANLFPGGYCTRDCNGANLCDPGSACFCLEPDGAGGCGYSICLDECVDDSECREDDYICDSDNTCFPG
jgi:serine protease